MEEYTNKFHEYVVHCSLETEDRQTITRHRDRLRYDIRYEVAMFDFTRVDEDLNKTRKAPPQIQLQRRNTFQAE